MANNQYVDFQDRIKVNRVDGILKQEGVVSAIDYAYKSKLTNKIQELYPLYTEFLKSLEKNDLKSSKYDLIGMYAFAAECADILKLGKDAVFYLVQAGKKEAASVFAAKYGLKSDAMQLSLELALNNNNHDGGRHKTFLYSIHYLENGGNLERIIDTLINSSSAITHDLDFLRWDLNRLKMLFDDLEKTIGMFKESGQEQQAKILFSRLCNSVLNIDNIYKKATSFEKSIDAYALSRLANISENIGDKEEAKSFHMRAYRYFSEIVSESSDYDKDLVQYAIQEAKAAGMQEEAKRLEHIATNN